MHWKAAILIVVALSGLAAPSYAGRLRSQEEMPAPRLVWPHETLAASKDNEFRWELGGMRPAFYELRIYEGRQTGDKAIVLKRKFENGETSFVVPAGTLKAGTTYMWTVRAGDGMKKSRRNFSIFETL